MSTHLPEPSLGLWLKRIVRDFGSREAIRRRTSREPGSVTYAELYEWVRKAAAGFATLGVHAGDRVGLIFDNRREWLICDLALCGQGAVDVPRGADTSNIEVVMILAHSGSRGAVVDTVERAKAIALAHAELPNLEFIITIDGGASKLTETFANDVHAQARDKHPLRFCSFDDLIARGADRIAHGIDDFELRVPKVESEDLLTLVYTSGTTGEPKGVQLSHRNVLSNCYHIRVPIPIEPGDVALSILPTWHMFERIIEYAVMDRGGILVYTDARKIRNDLASEQPRLMGTVPRIWETLRDSMQDSVSKLPPFKQKMFRLASNAAVGHLNARANGSIIKSILLAPAAALARKFIFYPKLEKAGLSKFRVCISGGGALPRALDEFFLAIGIPILNGYGLTETSPVLCVRRISANRPGSVGPPLNDTETKLVDLDGRDVKPGEVGILRVRGPQVTRGYYRNEEQTRRAFPEEGWFDTGDLAKIDKNGEIWIVGRAKDTIALRGGEKIEPERVETALKASPFILQSIVLGQDAKVLGAMIVPNLERLAETVTKEKLEAGGDWVTDESVRKIIRDEIDRCVSNAAGFRPYERPVRFVLLRKPIDVASGLMTQTLKLKRKAIVDRFSKTIGEMLKD
ncbi:MAG: AMP-dependent synthetase/ligase [Planctomycetota bacterium]